MQVVYVTLSAMDMDGNSVMCSVAYYDPLLLSKDLEKRIRPFCRILHNHKFVDMYGPARHPGSGEMPKADPLWVCNMDNFVKTAPLSDGEDHAFKYTMQE